MSELISGKEAWIAKSENKEVDWKLQGLDWQELSDSEFMGWDTSRFLGQTKYMFRLKPKTILLNGIEVPAPFEPKKGEDYFYLTDESDGGYDVHKHDCCTIEIAAWRTEEEIKQVVAALRSIFKGE